MLLQKYINYTQIRERHIMKIRLKIHKCKIRKIIKLIVILYASRCTARKNETYLRYTFFIDAKFVCFYILLWL